MTHGALGALTVTVKLYNVSHDMVYGLVVWLPQLDSAQHCCSKYGFTADDISCVSPNKIAKYNIQNVHPDTVDTARMLLELIFYYRWFIPGKFAIY